MLWQSLTRDRRFAGQFKRQTPVGRHIPDFVSFVHRIAIELVNPAESEAIVADRAARQAWLEARDYRVIEMRGRRCRADLAAELARLENKPARAATNEFRSAATRSVDPCNDRAVNFGAHTSNPGSRFARPGLPARRRRRDPKCLHARGQRGRLDVQHSGGAARAEHLAVAGLQGRQDVGALLVAHLGRSHDCRPHVRLLAASRCDRRMRADRVRQIDAQPSVVRQDRRALDHVLQFADIAGPVVALQPARIAFDSRRPDFSSLASLIRKCWASSGMSSRRSRSGTRLDRKHVEPEIQVLAKPAALHLLLEVAVGGGDHAHVDGAGALLADALEIALLQHAQQLALQLQRNFADLVEKQRAAVGELEAADAVAHRAGEGALDVAEELALEQFARDRCAVDADQRPVAARAGFVDGARDQLLAGAGFAGDHDGGSRSAPPA